MGCVVSCNLLIVGKYRLLEGYFKPSAQLEGAH